MCTELVLNTVCGHDGRFAFILDLESCGKKRRVLAHIFKHCLFELRTKQKKYKPSPVDEWKYEGNNKKSQS